MSKKYTCLIYTYIYIYSWIIVVYKSLISTIICIYGPVSRVHGPPTYGIGGYPPTHSTHSPPHPPPPPTTPHHLPPTPTTSTGVEGYIDICIYTYIYILYTFAHTHTTYVYTHTCVYHIYRGCVKIRVWIGQRWSRRMDRPVGSGYGSGLYILTRNHIYIYMYIYIYTRLYNLHIHIGTITISGGRGGTTRRWAMSKPFALMCWWKKLPAAPSTTGEKLRFEFQG